MIPYGKQSISEDDVAAVSEVLKTDYLTTGPMVDAFEKKMAQYCGASHGIAVSNGTAALHVAAMASGLDQNDHGITSPNTFLASANCMAYCKAIPDFADIESETYCIDAEEIKKKIKPETRLVIPVHFAGHPCDMEKIWQVAKDKGLFVIEDAAHALGSAYRDKNGNWIRVGACRHSHATILSFHPVKNITTGEGGMILTNDDELARKCKLLRSHGIERDSVYYSGLPLRGSCEAPWYYEMQMLGYNYRITDIQCALGIIQMDRLDDFAEKRRTIWQRYNTELKDIEDLTLPMEKDGVYSAWHLYAAKARNRDQLLQTLRNERIGAHAMYIPVHLQPWYQREFGFKKGDFPISEAYFEESIILPLYPDLSYDEQGFIIDKIRQFFRKNT